MNEKIVKIEWNPNVIAVPDQCTQGRTTTETYSCNSAEVNSRSDVKEIIEVTPVVYDIIYRDCSKLRVINPIEVRYE